MGSSWRRKRAQRCSSSDFSDCCRSRLERMEGTQEAPIRNMTPADVARAPPPGGPQGVEPAVIADPGEGVLIDGGLGQFGQSGPGLKAAGVAAATAETAARSAGGRAIGGPSASSTSALIGPSTVSGLPLVNWTE